MARAIFLPYESPIVSKQKPKFTLTLKPTFPATVAIPVPGAPAEEIQFTFKGRTRDQFKEFVESLEGRNNVDVILDVASGWELEDAFTRENIETLDQNYIAAGAAILDKYILEMNKARRGN